MEETHVGAKVPEPKDRRNWVSPWGVLSPPKIVPAVELPALSEAVMKRGTHREGHNRNMCFCGFKGCQKRSRQKDLRKTSERLQKDLRKTLVFTTKMSFSIKKDNRVFLFLPQIGILW